MESCFGRIEISVCGTQGLDTAVRGIQREWSSIFYVQELYGVCVEIHQMFLNDPPYSLIYVCVCVQTRLSILSQIYSSLVSYFLMYAMHLLVS